MTGLRDIMNIMLCRFLQLFAFIAQKQYMIFIGDVQMKRRSAGIITFHESRNYGAVLQAYALQQKMSQIIPQTEIINYQNPEIAEVIKLWKVNGKGPKAYIHAMLSFVFRYRKRSAFNKYMKKYMKLSPKADRKNIASIASDYDVLITGSDQVWHTGLTGNDGIYFLDFAKPHQQKIAYAASFGDKRIELDNDKKELLKKFDLITLRENLMLDEVQEISGKKAELCCDPTLLISSEQWKDHASKKLTDKPYVFMFMIDESKELAEYAANVAKEKGLALISNKNDFSFFRNSMPNDFLSWVLNAEYVVTNSFHGTVFSLLFGKKFVSHTFTASGTSKKRIIQLLETVGLSHRNTRNANIDLDAKEDWESVWNEINKMSTASWNVIKNWFENN